MENKYDYNAVIESYKEDANFKNFLYSELNNRDNNGFNNYFLTYFSKNSSLDIKLLDRHHLDEKEVYHKWRDKIYSVLLNDYAINGEKSSIEDYIADTVKNINDESIITRWFSDLYLDAMESSKLKIGILHALSHIEYKRIYPVGQMIALTGLSDADDEVIEYSIKAFENWQDKEAVRLLKDRQLKKPWLQDYLNVVVEYLEEL
ncbi:MAG: hypothetical protein IKZ43_07500 [Acidaminococcaceae bacterium]|nr:hypothetical protein [Acidaminococcaceae bacterium]